MFLFNLRTVNLIFQKKKKEIIVLLIYKVQLYYLFNNINHLYLFENNTNIKTFFEVKIHAFFCNFITFYFSEISMSFFYKKYFIL